LRLGHPGREGVMAGLDPASKRLREMELDVLQGAEE
jgi:hypothetical protein